MNGHAMTPQTAVKLENSKSQGHGVGENVRVDRLDVGCTESRQLVIAKQKNVKPRKGAES